MGIRESFKVWPQWCPSLRKARRLGQPVPGAVHIKGKAGPAPAACLQLGIVHRFTRPYTPRTNGKAERFIQTALREWAYARHYADSTERDLQLDTWLDYYNRRRPHGSLAYAAPITRAPVGTTS